LLGSLAVAQDARAIVRLSSPGLGSMYTMPFQIAQEQGFYRQEGLDVRILGGVKTAPSVQMLVGGSVEVTQTVGTTTLAAILQGAPLKVVMVFNDKPSYALYAKKSIRSFAELKGARLPLSRRVARGIGFSRSCWKRTAFIGRRICKSFTSARPMC
jgi:ABC-type nitrate/sulfonate/bicarbonate transport system substrate-binding protein